MEFKGKMSEIPDFIDEKLWITLNGDPEKKLYLLYNPHTHKGRMGVWNPRAQDVFYVSKNEIETCSIEASYWIKGFICGNEPDPPRTRKGCDLAEDDPKMVRWREAIKLFSETGFWWQGRARKCTNCGKKLLPSQLGLLCPDCIKNSHTGTALLRDNSE